MIFSSNGIQYNWTPSSTNITSHKNREFISWPYSIHMLNKANYTYMADERCKQSFGAETHGCEVTWKFLCVNKIIILKQMFKNLESEVVWIVLVQDTDRWIVMKMVTEFSIYGVSNLLPSRKIVSFLIWSVLHCVSSLVRCISTLWRPRRVTLMMQQLSLSSFSICLVDSVRNNNRILTAPFILVFWIEKNDRKNTTC